MNKMYPILFAQSKDMPDDCASVMTFIILFIQFWK